MKPFKSKNWFSIFLVALKKNKKKTNKQTNKQQKQNSYLHNPSNVTKEIMIRSSYFNKRNFKFLK